MVSDEYFRKYVAPFQSGQLYEVEKLNNLGNFFLENKDVFNAIEAYTRALSLNPGFPEAYHNLSVAFRAQGDLEKAACNAEIAISLRPTFVEALINLGEICLYSGLNEKALSQFLKAAAINPSNWKVQHYLGVVLQRQGKYSQAKENYQSAIDLFPSAIGSMNNLGCILMANGNLEGAIEKFLKILAINPSFVEAACNLGTAYFKVNDYKKAENAFLEVLKLRENLTEAILGLALVLGSTGRLSAGIGLARSVASLSPSNSNAQSTFLFLVNYSPDFSSEEIFCFHRNFGKNFDGNAYHQSHQPPIRCLDRPNRKIRIGYVSGDFHSSSMSQFLAPLIFGHSRQKFEIFLYDQSSVDDLVKQNFMNQSVGYRNTVALSDDELHEKIRADAIDILVDLSGHTEGNRLPLFAKKPAPLSMSWGGYGYTTGLKEIDYFLTSWTLCPEGSESVFSENLLRLSRLPGFRPRASVDIEGDSPAYLNGFITFGCLSRAIRINDNVIMIWAKILQECKNSILIVNSADFKFENCHSWLIDKFAGFGISRERLKVGYSSPPWQLFSQIDIMLDCWPHNSGTTLIESLYMGVPYVTLASRPSVGRIGASVLNCIGRNGWIAFSEEDYIKKITCLANDFEGLSNARLALRSELESSDLFDYDGFILEIESMYETVWKNANCSTDN